MSYSDELEQFHKTYNVLIEKEPLYVDYAVERGKFLVAAKTLAESHRQLMNEITALKADNERLREALIEYNWMQDDLPDGIAGGGKN
jgi:hypothetical protein